MTHSESDWDDRDRHPGYARQRTGVRAVDQRPRAGAGAELTACVGPRAGPSAVRDTSESRWPSPGRAECGPRPAWIQWPGRGQGPGGALQSCAGGCGAPALWPCRVWLLFFYSPLGDTVETAGPEWTPAPCGSPRGHPSVSLDEPLPGSTPPAHRDRAGSAAPRSALSGDATARGGPAPRRGVCPPRPAPGCRARLASLAVGEAGGLSEGKAAWGFALPSSVCLHSGQAVPSPLRSQGPPERRAAQDENGTAHGSAGWCAGRGRRLRSRVLNRNSGAAGPLVLPQAVGALPPLGSWCQVASLVQQGGRTGLRTGLPGTLSFVPSPTPTAQAS